MRRLVLSLTALSSAGFLLSGTASAGACGAGVPAQQCKVPVHVMTAPAHSVDAVRVYNNQPLGYLRSFNYRSAPAVSITRIYGQGQTVGMTDFPSKFTDGCNPASTKYCRQAAPQPAPAPVHPPVAMPVRQPAPAPVVRVAAQPLDPNRFTPRVYGSNELIPGIAHVPTSIVDRDWNNAMAALNSGRTQPQPVVSGGMVPYPAQVSAPVAAPLSIAQPPMVAPMPAPVHGTHHMGTVTETVSGADYWEKVSGPTMFGDTMASQVICKRKGQSVQVERPVIGVPQPVPVPMGCAAPGGVSSHVLAGAPVSGRYGH